MKNATYHKRQEGNATVFEVAPGVPGKGCSMVILAFFCFLIVVNLLLSRDRSGAVAFSVPAGLALLWVIYGDFRPRAQRKARTFRVTPDAVETNGMTFKNADIHRLIIKNPLSGGDEEVVVVPSMMNPAAGIGTGFRAAAAQICFSLDLEAGGKAYILAGGMDQTTAFGLLSDVARILGRSVQ